MYEDDLAIRFSAEVDELLHGGVIAQKPAPEMYNQVIDLAKRLIALDFSDETQLLLPLRRRLLEKLEKRSADSFATLSGELDDDDLLLVAGGTRQGVIDKGGTDRDCGRKASDIHGAVCRVCGRPRDQHS